MNDTNISNLTATLPMIASMIGGAFVMYFTLKKKISEGLTAQIDRLGEQNAEQHKTLAAAIETSRRETKSDITQLHSKMDSVRSEIREDVKEVSRRVNRLERAK